MLHNNHQSFFNSENASDSPYLQIKALQQKIIDRSFSQAPPFKDLFIKVTIQHTENNTAETIYTTAADEKILHIINEATKAANHSPTSMAWTNALKKIKGIQHADAINALEIFIQPFVSANQPFFINAADEVEDYITYEKSIAVAKTCLNKLQNHEVLDLNLLAQFENSHHDLYEALLPLVEIEKNRCANTY